MQIQLKVDIKTIKRAYAILDMDIPSEEEINDKFSKIVVDLSGESDPNIKQAELGFVCMAIAETLK